MNELFQDIYDTLVEKVKEVSIFTERNIIEYAQEDQTKRLYSSADYPRLEIKPVSMGHTGSTSSSWNYTAMYDVTVAVGTMDFSKVNPIMRELRIIANKFLSWRKRYDNGDLALGHSHSDVSFGKFAPERGLETIDGWAFRFTITFHAIMKQEE